MTINKGRVLVAMSGGVDSSVTAALLIEDGYEVVGATLLMQPCEEPNAGRSSCSAAGPAQAREVAELLGIPHYVLDCRQPFHDAVLHHSWLEYSRGRTPNPCVVCNARIKFGLLMEEAKALGATKIATGHYVQLLMDSTGHPFLRRGLDRGKDQSYFLFALGDRHLTAALFPLGRFTKAEVREKARCLGLPNADRKESQDACFLAGGEGFAEILRRRFQGEAKGGEFVDGKGTVLGRHQGFHRFTVGQRRGIGLALGHPAWVKAIDAESSRVVIAMDRRELLSKGLIATGLRWHHHFPRSYASHCSVQVRYRHTAAPAAVEHLAPDRVRVVFREPVRAVTPGQVAVFYDGDILLGGGWIERCLSSEEVAQQAPQQQLFVIQQEP